MQAAEQGNTWLEVAVNGPWTSKRQPHMPVSVEEIVEQAVACVKAGAAIVHATAYDAASGQPTQDAEVYARIIGGIRNQVDAIVYPAVAPNAAAGDGAQANEQRFAHLGELARRGLIEWMPVVPGSVNLSSYDDLLADRPGTVQTNSEEDLRHALRLAMRHGLHPSYGIYEPGFVRLGATLHWRASCPAPVYRFLFTSAFTFSFPPEDYALTAYLKLLDQVAPGAPWMLAGLQADVLPLIPRAVAEGGHVRVGLEDAPWGSALTNLQWVEQAAQRIALSGAELATAQEVRAAINPEDIAPR